MSTGWLISLLLLISLSIADETEEIEQNEEIIVKEDMPPDADMIIDVTNAIPDDECKIKSQKGDTLSMHYTGTLYKDGSKFDSSVDRNQPFDFEVGAGRVIKGWDQGLIDMCINEKRTLTIPSDLGYGSQGSGASIPGGATLVFQTQLLDITRPKPDFTVMTYQQYEDTKNVVVDITQDPENEYQVIAFVKKASKREQLFDIFAKHLQADPKISFYKVHLKKDDKYKVIMRRNNRNHFADERLDGAFEVIYNGKLAPTKKSRKSVFKLKQYDIGTWIDDQRVPLFVHLDKLGSDDPYSILYTTPKIPQSGIIVIRIPDNDDDAVQKLREEIVDVVRDLRANQGYMVVLSSKDYDNIGFTAGVSMVLIYKSIVKMPKMPSGWHKASGGDDYNQRARAFVDQYSRQNDGKDAKEWLVEYRYQFNGDVTGESLKGFYQQAVVDKSLQRWIRSAENTQGVSDVGYDIVTAHSFNDIVLDKGTDVLVLYCTESSYACAAVIEEYERLAKHMQTYYKGKAIKIAYVDGELNDVEDIRVTSFPIMVLYTAGTNKIEKGKLLFPEQRATMDDIVDFIDEFATALNKEEL